jgi:hypothetical protein
LKNLLYPPPPIQKEPEPSPRAVLVAFLESVFDGTPNMELPAGWETIQPFTADELEDRGLLELFG